MESGLRGLPQNPNGERTPGLADGKFEEYRDINGVTAGTGLFLENLRLRLFRPDEAYSIEMAGKDWGLHTQEFHLMGERLGQWQAGFDWDQMRHVYSTDSQTLLKVFGDNVFIVRGAPGWRPPAAAWNDGLGWSCSAAVEEQQRLRRPDQPAVVHGAVVLQYLADGQDELLGGAHPHLQGRPAPLRDGLRQPGRQLPRAGPAHQPDHLRVQNARQLYHGDVPAPGRLHGLSVFVNDFPWVRADNPCNGNGVTTIAGGCGAPGNSGQFGTTSLPPNNQAHTFNLQGGVNLPMRTRVNANFTYQLRFQNQDFQQQTYSNGLVAANPSLQLPQSSLNGNVQTALVNLDVTSRPLQAPVTFTLKYRLYDYMDNSDTPVFSAFIINDQNAITQTVGQEPMRAGRYSFLRQNADVAGRYQFTPTMAVTLGLGWEGWNRSHDYEVTVSNEALAKAAVDYTPTDWLLARLSYTAGFRRGGGYNTNAWGEANMNQPPTFDGSASQLTTLRKFNEGGSEPAGADPDDPGHAQRHADVYALGELQVCRLHLLGPVRAAGGAPEQ